MGTAIMSIIGALLNQLDQNKGQYGNSARTYGLATSIAQLMKK